jgi:PBSX family phage terminase large subunit
LNPLRAALEERLSEKQLDYFDNSTGRINIADGAVRSGKTYASLLRLVHYSVTGPPGPIIIVGKTERTVRRNVIRELQEMPSPIRDNVRYVQGTGTLWIGNRQCYIAGANDERAEEKIRGFTAAGAYCNEVSLFPEGVFNQVLARCSVPGAKIFGDTNPDSPYHWLHTDYLARPDLLEAGRLKRWRFTLNDNPALDPDYKADLTALYSASPLWLRRMINGEWVMAEGAIYDMFNHALHVVDELPQHFERYAVGVDYGTATVSTFLLLGLYQNTWYVVKEYYYDAQIRGMQKTDAEFSADYLAWIEDIDPLSVDVDPSAASFKLQLRRDGVRRVYDADNEVLEGIRKVANALHSGRLKIHSGCTNLISQMSTYAWDEKAQEKGEDKPLKLNDHGPDALRYASMRIFGKRRTLRLVG